ncbi:hypothetical protein ACFL96_09785 [Thermoproteota archaeon]
MINALDIDDGIRILGNISGLQGGGFIFISTVESIVKMTQKYCVNTVERIFNEEVKMFIPGGKEKFLYFKASNDIIKYVEKNAAKPLSAWYY